MMTYESIHSLGVRFDTALTVSERYFGEMQSCSEYHPTRRSSRKWLSTSVRNVVNISSARGLWVGVWVCTLYISSHISYTNVRNIDCTISRRK